MPAEPIKFAQETKQTAKQLLAEKGVRMHLFGKSAEGLRSGMNRELASKRAARPHERLASGG